LEVFFLVLGFWWLIVWPFVLFWVQLSEILGSQLV
jgi:hypothetical protein